MNGPDLHHPRRIEQHFNRCHNFQEPPIPQLQSPVNSKKVFGINSIEPSEANFNPDEGEESHKSIGNF